MTESKETKPVGVQKSDAPTKPAPVNSPTDANKKPNTETLHPNAPVADKATDTPAKDTGQGGVVATTGNQSLGKVAEPGTANTPNPPKTAAGLNDTPPAAGLETPSGGVRTSSDPSTPEAGKPIPPDDTPVPDDKTLDELDAKHGLTKGTNDDETSAGKVSLTDPDASDKQFFEEEKAAIRKIIQMVDTLPKTTPDSTIFGGYGGVIINFGDLRRVARAGKRGLED